MEQSARGDVVLMIIPAQNRSKRVCAKNNKVFRTRTTFFCVVDMQKKERDTMTRTNGLYLVIGALVVAVIGLGGYTYHEKTKPKAVEFSIGQDGVKVQEK